jgi:REP element-mobilizing transposase RayT
MVSRRKRPALNWRYPLHVVLRLREDVGRLRDMVRFKHMKRAFRDGCQKFGLRMCEFSVQNTHIHLIVEADSKEALSRGMQALEIRLAWQINRTRKKRGRVFADRYYARPLRTLAEVANAVHYVHYNWRHHGESSRPSPSPGGARKGDKIGLPVDPFSTLSGEACYYDWYDQTMTVAQPRTWLLIHAPPRAEFRGVASQSGGIRRCWARYVG